MLIRLRRSYAGPIAEYDAALAAGRETLDRFTVFLRQQAGVLVGLSKGLAAEDAARSQVEQLLSVISLRLKQVRQVEIEVDRALAVDVSRPLPDYETARSILAGSLTMWAEEFYRIGQMFGGWRDSLTTDITVRRFAGTHREDYASSVEALARDADPLKQLPPLELARIGRSLEAGETAIRHRPHRRRASVQTLTVARSIRLRSAHTRDHERSTVVQRRGSPRRRDAIAVGCA